MDKRYDWGHAILYIESARLYIPIIYKVASYLFDEAYQYLDAFLVTFA